MELFIDSADLKAIAYWSDILPIDGVTTNPTLLARSGLKATEAVQRIFAVIGEEKLVHAQVLAQDFAGIVQQARLISGWHRNIAVKIPVTLEGLKAIKVLAPEGMKITATAVSTAHQGLLAAKAGAVYLAPYVNRIDNISGDGVAVVRDLVSIMSAHGLSAKVLAASFQNARQVLQALAAGAHGVALSTNLLEHVAGHGLTDASEECFVQDYRKAFGTTEL